jgi:phosphoglycerate dehydrogenase-like enzyme
MINESALAKMKSTAVLINTARGNIVDEKALYNALRKGIIASAALDIVDEDPIKSDNKLISLDNITFTPHIAGRSPHTEMRGYRQIAVQVTRYLRGEDIRPQFLSNKIS